MGGGGDTVFILIYRHLVPLYFLPRILDCFGGNVQVGRCDCAGALFSLQHDVRHRVGDGCGGGLHSRHLKEWSLCLPWEITLLKERLTRLSLLENGING